MTHAPEPPFVVRSPDDLVAFVPLALGFTPEDSAVLLTFGPHGSLFHARVDLVPDPDGVVEVLLAPCLRHGVTRVILLCYGPAGPSEDLAWRLREEFTEAGIELVEALRVAQDHWYAVLPGAPAEDYAGHPLRLDSHEFTARGVFSGRVCHASREELRSSVEAGPRTLARATLDRTRVLAPDRLGALALEAATAGRPFSDRELARVAVSLRDGHRRDRVWACLERARVTAAVELWRDAVQRLADEDAPDACAVLAFAAWLAGDGALAWCAVERAQRVCPGHPLARLVAQLLEQASSPEEWESLHATICPHGPPAA